MNRCYVCGQTVPPNLVIGAPSTPLCPTTQVINQSRTLSLGRPVSERFIKPIVPLSANITNSGGGIPTGSQIPLSNPPPQSTSPATIMDLAKY